MSPEEKDAAWRAQATCGAYSVTLWFADPEKDDDACATGEDFDTLEEARKCMSNLDAHFDMTYYRDCAWVMLDGPDVHEVTYDAEKHKRAQKEDKLDRSLERSEGAMQAGMAFGCQGYNDYMED